jgi:hypothetical protein
MDNSDPDLKPRGGRKKSSPAVGPANDTDSSGVPGPRLPIHRTEVAAVQPSVDDFDLADIRVTADLVAIKEVAAATLRKPARTEWVRIHPDFELPVRVLKEDGTSWILVREMAEAYKDLAKPHVVYLARARHTSEVFLWLVPVPSGDRPNTWHTSHATAAAIAKTEWVSMASNMGLRRYDVRTAAYNDEPQWPEEGAESIAKRVLAPLLIRREDHPALRRSRGEV